MGIIGQSNKTYPPGQPFPIKRFSLNRDPTTTDKRDFILGDEWLNTLTGDWFKLVSLENGIATWKYLTSEGEGVSKFIPDSGTSPVVPNTDGEVTIVGGNGITTVGGTNQWTTDMQSPFTGNFTFTGTLSADTFQTTNTTAAIEITDNLINMNGSDANVSLIITPKGTGGGVISTNLTVGETVQDVDFVINGASITSTIALHTSGVTDLGGFASQRHSDIAAFGAHTIMIRSRGTEASPTVVQNNDSLSRVISGGYDGVNGYAQAAEIRVEVDGTPGAADMPGRFLFLTSPDGTQVPVEALRIDNNQDVLCKGTGALGSPIGTTAQRPSTPANGMGRYNSTDTTIEFYEEGAWRPSGRVLQIVDVSTAALVNANTVIPYDNTIPQITEGTQIFTLAITPKYNNSKLVIHFAGSGSIASGSAAWASVALFQDATANALAAGVIENAETVNGANANFSLIHTMTSGTTSSTTFQIRIGPNIATSFYLNGDVTGAQRYGGVSSAIMTIVEYKQ